MMPPSQTQGRSVARAPPERALAAALLAERFQPVGRRRRPVATVSVCSAIVRRIAAWRPSTKRRASVRNPCSGRVTTESTTVAVILGGYALIGAAIYVFYGLRHERVGVTPLKPQVGTPPSS
jgi:hypothetical protein